jgi:hypothetical protein
MLGVGYVLFLLLAFLLSGFVGLTAGSTTPLENIRNVIIMGVIVLLMMSGLTFLSSSAKGKKVKYKRLRNRRKVAKIYSWCSFGLIVDSANLLGGGLVTSVTIKDNAFPAWFWPWLWISGGYFVVSLVPIAITGKMLGKGRYGKVFDLEL